MKLLYKKLFLTILFALALVVMTPLMSRADDCIGHEEINETESTGNYRRTVDKTFHYLGQVSAPCCASCAKPDQVWTGKSQEITIETTTQRTQSKSVKGGLTGLFKRLVFYLTLQDAKVEASKDGSLVYTDKNTRKIPSSDLSATCGQVTTSFYYDVKINASETRTTNNETGSKTEVVQSMEGPFFVGLAADEELDCKTGQAKKMATSRCPQDPPPATGG